MSGLDKKNDESVKDIESQPLNAPKIQRPAVNNQKAISSCLLYCFCSVSMVLVNKSLASSYNKKINGALNVLLVVFQAVTAVVAVDICKRMKMVDYPSFSMATARQWAPVNIWFCLMLFTGMASLMYNSVPMVTVFKNITNIITTFADYHFFGSSVDKLVLLSFGIMLLGALLASGSSLEMNPTGVFWMTFNCFSTSGYIVNMKFATRNVKLSKFGMVFYNNVLCAVFLIPVTIINGEMSLFLNTEAIHTLDYFAKNVFAGFVGFFLNFASLNCVANTSPTTYATVGSLNKIPITFLGYFIFKDNISADTWCFIAFSMCGGFLYSYAKIRKTNMAVSKQAHSG